MRVFSGPESGGEAIPTSAPPAALFVPARPEELSPHYDLTVSQPSPDQPQAAGFDRWLAESAQRRGLTCALLHDGVVREVVERLYDGRLTIGYHLDYFALWHVADDVYARLAVAVQDAGGRPVNLPARARTFTDKAVAHAELLRQGLGTPATVIVRPDPVERALPAALLARLHLEEPGARLFIKPANGFGGRGVVRVDGTPAALAAAVAAARRAEPADSLLLQREVRWPVLDCDDGVARPAYWRILHCLGELLPFWWQPQEAVGAGKPSYVAVTDAELRRHRLQPVLAYARALADLSGLDWFSTELCLSTGREQSRFAVLTPAGIRPVVAIDYLNDQCDMDVQSRWPGAVPDETVRRCAERFAQAAFACRWTDASEERLAA